MCPETRLHTLVRLCGCVYRSGQLSQTSGLLQILEESIKSSIIADKSTPKLYVFCLYFHKHLEIGSVSDLTSHKHLKEEEFKMFMNCQVRMFRTLYLTIDSCLGKGKLYTFETGSNAQSDPPVSVFVLLYQ